MEEHGDRARHNSIEYMNSRDRVAIVGSGNWFVLTWEYDI